jgi:hypothetical protein
VVLSVYSDHSITVTGQGSVFAAEGWPCPGAALNEDGEETAGGNDAGAADDTLD